MLQTPRVDAHGKVKISAPMNGTPIPAGYKFGGKDAPPPEQSSSDRREKAKSRSFWGFGGKHGMLNSRLDAFLIDTAAQRTSLTYLFMYHERSLASP